MKKLMLFIMFFVMSNPTYAFECSAARVFIHNGNIEGDAYWDEQDNEIHVSKKFLSRFSTQHQLFIMNHECGHAKGLYDETEADKYAYKRLSPSNATINEICAFHNSYDPDSRSL